MKKIPYVIWIYLAVSVLPCISYVYDVNSLIPNLDSASKAPWAVLALVGFLGWRLNQTRILFSAVALLALFAWLGQPHTASDLGPKITAFGLPLGLALLFSLREAPLFSQRSLWRIFLAALPSMVLVGLSMGDKHAYESTVGWKPLAALPNSLPQAAWLGLPILGVLSAFHPEPKVRPFLQALAFATLPLMLSLQGVVDARPVSTLAYLCASGILLWAILAMYWQRVYLDELTGVSNRRALDEKLASLDTGYSLAMVDIDHFKKFNDSYGHEEGDNVLRLVARHINDGSGGRAYRYGGEEFCMVFENWSSEAAAGQADAIRDTLAKREFSIRLPQKIRKKTSADDRGSLHAKSVSVQVTISIGVAKPDKDHPRPEQVIKLADQGLYAAKENGRNCVVRKN